ncbi:histidine kinase [Niabella aquatica]
MQEYVQESGWLFAMLPFFMTLILTATLIYVNAYLLVPLLLDKKRVIGYTVCIILLIALCTFARSVALRYCDSLLWPSKTPSAYAYFTWTLLDNFWAILISTLLLFSLRWIDQKDKVKNIEITQLQSELRYLRTQINPHFLFNGLNTIYGNINSENEEARNIVLQFSDLLRYSLYEADVEWVELGQEIACLENYVALQKARRNQNLEISFSVKAPKQSVKIAPLIFIPFVENAFKHGLAVGDTDSFVEISLHQKVQEHILFHCSNSYEDRPAKQSGIGLANVKRRLNLLYPEKHRLKISDNGHVYSIDLCIELSSAKSDDCNEAFQ